VNVGIKSLLGNCEEEYYKLTISFQTFASGQNARSLGNLSPVIKDSERMKRGGYCVSRATSAGVRPVC